MGCVYEVGTSNCICGLRIGLEIGKSVGKEDGDDTLYNDLVSTVYNLAFDSNEE